MSEEAKKLVREMRPYLVGYRAEVREEAKNHPRAEVRKSAGRIVREIDDLLERSRDV